MSEQGDITRDVNAFRGIGADADAGTRWNRTQRDAGIEFRAWESRVKIPTPWIVLLIRGGLIVLGAGVVFALFR